MKVSSVRYDVIFQDGGMGFWLLGDKVQELVKGGQAELLGVIPGSLGLVPLELGPEHVQQTDLVVARESALDLGDEHVLVVVVLDVADRTNSDDVVGEAWHQFKHFITFRGKTSDGNGVSGCVTGERAVAGS